MLWWGYRQTDGTLIVRPYLNDTADRTLDRVFADDVAAVFGPFAANTEAEALKVLASLNKKRMEADLRD